MSLSLPLPLSLFRMKTRRQTTNLLRRLPKDIQLRPSQGAQELLRK
jgi:hypothetical protein